MNEKFDVYCEHCNKLLASDEAVNGWGIPYLELSIGYYHPNYGYKISPPVRQGPSLLEAFILIDEQKDPQKIGKIALKVNNCISVAICLECLKPQRLLRLARGLIKTWADAREEAFGEDAITKELLTCLSRWKLKGSKSAQT